MKTLQKVLLSSILILSLQFFLTSCQSTCSKCNEKHLIKFNGKALGTFYTVSYYDASEVNYQEGLDSLFSAFNHALSIYDSTSVISKVNRNEEVVLNAWFIEVFNLSKTIYASTGGYFDPSVAPLVNAWGFGFTNADEMTVEKIDSILTFVGFDKADIIDNKVVKKDLRLKLDFNAIAKGYCADVGARYLEGKGISSYLIEIGGEICSKGTKPDGSFWKIGIEKPALDALDGQDILQVINITDKALATSGNYRRYLEKDGKRISHTIDAKTGYPTENELLSVTVIANNCITADAYATAFMAMGLNKAFEFAENNPSIEAFFIFNAEDNSLKTKHTKGFSSYLED